MIRLGQAARFALRIGIVASWPLSATSYAMGLRSFVALPVDKGGTVLRLTLETEQDTDIDRLTASAAYGLSANQTILLGFPYQLSPPGNNRQGDLSALYRHVLWRQDTDSGTTRTGLLGGLIAPTESNRDSAIQLGMVYTRFIDRHELDLDLLYQSGMDNRPDSGRYDLSWQYRLSPSIRPDWGLPTEVNTVLELNGRWKEGNNTAHQLTLGLQRIHPKYVVEGGIAQDLNNSEETRYLVSFRTHF